MRRLELRYLVHLVLSSLNLVSKNKRATRLPPSGAFLKWFEHHATSRGELQLALLSDVLQQAVGSDLSGLSGAKRGRGRQREPWSVHASSESTGCVPGRAVRCLSGRLPSSKAKSP